jgi:hypothetical protein
MINLKQIMPVIVMQFIPLVILPLSILFSINGVVYIVIAILVFGSLGYAIIKRKAWARNLSIFVQGFNIIVRLMMLFPNARTKDGPWDMSLIIASLLSIAISFWFLQRLDKTDFQSYVTS